MGSPPDPLEAAYSSTLGTTTQPLVSSLSFRELGFPILQILFLWSLVSCSFQDKKLKTSPAWAGPDALYPTAVALGAQAPAPSSSSCGQALGPPRSALNFPEVFHRYMLSGHLETSR